MNIRLFDHRSEKSTNIASLDRERVLHVCRDLKLNEVTSIESAELVLGHFDYAQICNLSGWYTFRTEDILNWRALFREFLSWGAVISAESRQKLETAERSGGEEKHMKLLLLDELNGLLGREELIGMQPFKNLELGPEATYLASLGVPHLHENELYRLNRVAVETALGDYVARAKFDLQNFPDQQVVIFVTTQQGFPDRFPYQHSVLRLPGRTRYLLFAKDMSALTKSAPDLRDILSLRHPSADQIVRHAIENAPQSVLRLFFAHQPDLLQALMILCIGYLSARPDAKPDDAKWKANGLQTVVQQIGLASALEAMGGNAKELRARLAKEAPTVEERQWWLRGFGVLDSQGSIREERWKQFKANLEEQWKESGNETLPDALVSFIKVLYEKPVIAASNLVAGVYRELMERLQAPSWRKRPG